MFLNHVKKEKPFVFSDYLKSTRMILMFLGFILIWEGSVFLFKIPFYILPDPAHVLMTGAHHIRIILREASYTLVEILVGFGAGCLFGILMALLVAFIKPFRYWLLPVLLVTQALPIFAIAPLIVIWFGYGLASKTITIMIMLFFPVSSAFLDGLQRTPVAYLEMAKTMNASNWNTFVHIRIPAALPALGSGLRMAAVFAPIGALASEWVGASHGLGLLMIKADLRMQIDLMFACLFMIMSVALVLYFSIDALLKKYITW